MFKLLGTKLQMTSAYHPQSDGQTERLNQCLETYLRCCTSQHPHQWSKWLSLAEYWYNTSFHTSLKMTPFQALYGYIPTQLSLSPYLDTTNPEVSQLVQERMKTLELPKANLTEAQARMKFYADKHRVERSFEVGDEVYLKLQPYRQKTVSYRKSSKLANKYYGPNRIIQKIGSHAYKLQLPTDAKVHNVFHVSLLKKKISPKVTSSSEIPEAPEFVSSALHPFKILNTRVLHLPEGNSTQVLIQWGPSVDSPTTWDDWSVFTRKYPDWVPWGQGTPSEGGNVTPRNLGKK